VLVTPGHLGKFYELGGEGVTYAELAVAVSETTGSAVALKEPHRGPMQLSTRVKTGLTNSAA
jgi:uncharacterized protein YbjT (DUF2867 family)